MTRLVGDTTAGNIDTERRSEDPSRSALEYLHFEWRCVPELEENHLHSLAGILSRTNV